MCFHTGCYFTYQCVIYILKMDTFLSNIYLYKFYITVKFLRYLFDVM
jgi:hypothetical protein